MLNRRSLVPATLWFAAALSAHATIPVQQVSPTAAGPVTFAAAAIGGGTATQSVQLQLGISGTLSISVPASANGHQEFSVGTISGCTADGATNNAAGATCTVPVTFQPYYPGQRSQPLVVTLAGQVYTFGLTGAATGPLARLDPTNITTLTGASGTTSSTSPPMVDGVAIASGIVYTPEGLFIDSSNNLYIADEGHSRLRIAYQSANPQLACLIITENPTLFGLTAGANTCAGATSQPILGDIYTVAGSGTVAYNADNILATSAGMNLTGVASDAAGNLYIADEGNYRLRVVYQGGANIACLIVTENPTFFGLTAGANTCVGATSQPTPGFIYTVAGTGTNGFSGDAAIATAAKLYNPQELAVDSVGDIFITDFTASLTPNPSGRIRVVYNGGAAASQLITVENPAITAPTPGFIYTIAGGTTLTEGPDNALATSSGLLTLYAMHVDAYDNVYIADKTYGSTGLPLAVNRIRVVYNGAASSSNPLATLIAIENPSTVGTAASVKPGYIYTVAGGAGTTASAATIDGVLATSSKFAGIYGFTLDAAGDIIVSDRLNYTVRRVSAATGLISTIAGAPSATQSLYPGSAQPGPGPEYGTLWGPWSIVSDSAGGMYTTDNAANRVRAISSITSTTYPLILPATATQTVSGVVPFTETNIGTPGSTLTLTANAATSSFGYLVQSATPIPADCSANPPSILAATSLASAVSLTAGSSCSFGFAADPLNGGATTGNAAITDNSLNIAGTVHLMDATVTATGVTTVLSASPALITGGNPTVLTATLTTTAPSVPVTSGSVTFSITGGATLGTATLDPVLGTASITTSLLSAPTTSITTTYAGATTANPAFTPSTSVTVLTVSAKPATSLALITSNATPNLNQSIALTATVTSPISAGVFTGVVTFTDRVGIASPVTLGTPVTVTSAGVATLNISTLTAGTHTITATYSGDLVYANSATTTPVSEVVTTPAFSVTANTQAIAIQSGQTGTVTLTAISVGGYTGTLSASCGAGLPSGVTCAFNPSTLVFTGANNTQSMTVTITSVAAKASLENRATANSFAAMMLWFPASIAGIFALRRRSMLKRWQKMSLLAFVLCAGLVCIGGLSGCSGSSQTAAPLGTFNVPITLTDGTTTYTNIVTISILGNSSVI
jgi:hypothetical protein